MKIKITKIKELPDALNPNNIPENWSKTIEVDKKSFVKPTLNERFNLGFIFSTSGVQEIIDDNTFKTYSSIYKWKVLDE